MDASKKLDYISTLSYGKLKKVLRATRFDVSLVGRHFRSLEVIGGYYEAAVEEMGTCT